jgi:hypothetical protein
MRRIKVLLVTVSLGAFGLLPSTVFALEQPTFGGNNSSDYQPPTGNPQTNIPAPLQPTNTTLQPVATVLNQQALIQSGGLSVLTAPDKGASSTAAEPKTAKAKSALPTWIVGGILTLAAVAYILYKPDNNVQTAAVATPAQVKEVEIATTKTKTVKKPAKKTSRKKRKATKR